MFRLKGSKCHVVEVAKAEASNRRYATSIHKHNQNEVLEQLLHALMAM